MKIVILLAIAVLSHGQENDQMDPELYNLGDISRPREQPDPDAMKDLHEAAKQLLELGALTKEKLKKENENTEQAQAFKLIDHLKKSIDKQDIVKTQIPEDNFAGLLNVLSNQTNQLTNDGNPKDFNQEFQKLMKDPAFKALVGNSIKENPKPPNVPELDRPNNGIPGIQNEQQLANFVRDQLDMKDIDELRDGPLGSIMGDLINVDQFLSICKKDLSRLIKSSSELWAWRMLDSFGKPSSGILKGSMTWPGDYDECISSKAPPNNISRGFKGKFCWMLWDLRLGKSKRKYFITSGVCLPNSCMAQEIYDSYPYVKPEVDSKLFNLGLGISEVYLTGVNCHVDEPPMTASAISCLYLMGFFLVLVSLGTFIDYSFYNEQTLPHSNVVMVTYPRLKEDNESSAVSEKKDIQHKLNSYSMPSLPVAFFLCFSALRNGRTILNTVPSDTQFNFLHGFRVLCTLWVISGHVAMNGMSAIDNAEDAVEETSEWYFLSIVQGSYCVDCFFFMSGFLLTYTFLKNNKMVRNWKDWVYFYVHRYIRLVPPMALMMFFTTTIMPRIGSGPNWPNMKLITKECKNVWYWHMLFLNNFVDESNDCVSWTWYLANDFQFFAISPIFLIGFLRKPKAVLLSILVIMAVCNLTTAIISYSNEFLLTPAYVKMFAKTPIKASKIMETLTRKIYVKPYSRISPYFVGMSLGYYYYSNFNKKFNFSKGKQIAFWSLTVLIFTLSIFGVYGREITVGLAAIYNSFSRLTWALGVFWVMLACLTGYGGFVNTFLSWNVWFPLSRLSYANYLIHPLVMYWYYYTMQVPFYFTKMSLLIVYLGVAVISYILAFFFSIFFEAPFMKIEKLIRTGIV